MRPGLKITWPGGGDLPLAAFRLHRAVGWPVGSAEAELAPTAHIPAAGEQVEVEAWADESDPPMQLFAGHVLRGTIGAWVTRLHFEEATAPLARLRIDATYQATGAGDVIRDLCGRAGVVAGMIEPGAALPSVTLLQERPALVYILRLARASGLQVRTSADGALHATGRLPVTAATVVNAPDRVLSFTAARLNHDDSVVIVSGDGALGRKGPGADAWVLQELDSMTAGDGGRRLHFPELKAAADVARAQQAAVTARSEGNRFRCLVVAGPPPADLGDVLVLSGFDDADGPSRLVELRVLWGAETGLVSELFLNGLV